MHVIIVSVWFFSLCWASSWEVSCYIFVSPLGGTAMNRRWGTASFFPHMNTLLVHNIRLARLTSLNIIICFVQSSATVQSDLTLSSTTVLTVMRHNGQILYEWSFPLGETGSVCMCVCVWARRGGRGGGLYSSCILLSELPVTSFNLHNFPHLFSRWMETCWLTVTKKTHTLLS